MIATTKALRKWSSQCPYSQLSLAQHARTYSIQQTTSDTLSTSPRASKLTNRRLIHLHGDDVPKFLQGIITNNVTTEQANTGFFAAFLTAQGKVLHDVFVYSTTTSDWHKQETKSDETGYMIEVDAEQASTLLKHLKRHKLRSKFKMRLLGEEELDVWSIWKEDERWTQHSKATTDASAIGLQDTRAPGMGNRLLLSPGESLSTATQSEDVQEVPLTAYTVRRYLKGVPEGQIEIRRDDSLPMNYNFDVMNGIDFKKGCYIGQELTIRTHHTGVVRRRVLPVMLYDSANEPPTQQSYDESFTSSGLTTNADIMSESSKKRASGKLIASVGNVGLAMCRLEQMTDLNISGTGSTFDPNTRFSIENDHIQVGVKPFVPDWIRGRIREPKIQRRVE